MMKHAETSAEHHLDRATELLVEVDERMREGLDLEDAHIEVDLRYLDGLSAAASAHAAVAAAKVAFWERESTRA